MNFLSRLCATGLYTGFSPVAPGTVGSALALVLVWCVPQVGAASFALLLLLLIPLGVVTATRTEQAYGHDASQIKIDEIAGMVISLLGVPKTFVVYGAAFLLFRLLDVLKPFPVDELQELPGGWGVMADDIMAGVYTCTALHVALKMFG
jgi:phosphatidylglycerophosphatase A